MKSAISFILAAGAVGIGAQDIAGASSLPACGVGWPASSIVHVLLDLLTTSLASVH